MVYPQALGHQFYGYGTIDATQGPVVVGIELIGTVYLSDAYGKTVVGTSLDKVGDIEGEGCITAVVTADILSIDPHFGRCPYTAKMEQRPLEFRLWQLEDAHVQTLGSFVVGKAPVDRFLIALQCPVGRYGLLVEGRNIVVVGIELLRHIPVGSLGIGTVLETPGTIEGNGLLCHGRERYGVKNQGKDKRFSMHGFFLLF